MLTAVTRKLPVYSAPMPTQMVSDLLNTKALLSKGGHYISIIRGKLLVYHQVDSLLGGSEKTLVSQLTSSFEKNVALSI